MIDWLIRRKDDFADLFMVAVTLVVLMTLLGSTFVPSQAEAVRGYVPPLFAALVLGATAVVFFLPTFYSTKQLARRLFLIIAGTALVTATLGVSARVSADVCLPPPDLSVAPLPRLFFLVAVLAGMLWSAHALVEPVKRSVRRRWWNMGASDSSKAPDWSGILDMLCDEASDPMRLEEGAAYPDGKGEIRLEFSVATMGAFASVVALGILFGIALDYILYPRVPTIFVKDEGFANLASLSTNLTAFLALIAAAISIVFTYQQLRAKVRADSRQAWVTRVRKLMADVLANIHEVSWGKGDDQTVSSFHKSRTRLELHLNPAETDHRLLMLLIRACVLPSLKIDNDRETARQLVSVMDACTEERRRRFVKESFDVLSRTLNLYRDSAPGVVEQREGPRPEDRDRIVSFMFKLSHAILKREWERVRHTR